MFGLCHNGPECASLPATSLVATRLHLAKYAFAAIALLPELALVRPDLARRFAGPAAKCATEIRGIAEAERQRDIFV